MIRVTAAVGQWDSEKVGRRFYLGNPFWGFEICDNHTLIVMHSGIAGPGAGSAHRHPARGLEMQSQQHMMCAAKKRLCAETDEGNTLMVFRFLMHATCLQWCKNRAVQLLDPEGRRRLEDGWRGGSFVA